MNRFVVTAIVASCTICFTQVAVAADLPNKAPIAPAPAVAPSWTGFYAGLNLGYGWSTDQSAVVSGNDPSSQLFLSVSRPNANTSALNSNGILGGLQLGYNYQFAPSWLLGFETDFQFSNLNDSTSAAFSLAGFPFSSAAHQDINWFGTVRGRLGFLITPNWLVYGTGGFAYGRVERSYAFVNNSGITVIGGTLTCVANSVCAAGTTTDTRGGWTAGGGFEYLLPTVRILNHDTTVKLEYLYVNLGSQDVVAPGLTNPAASFRASFDDVAFHVVRGGVNVKF
jgi:outer membrane immunogenic protein